MSDKEVKAKVFAMYIGQLVISPIIKEPCEFIKCTYIMASKIHEGVKIFDNTQLILRTIDQLTDEEYLHCYKLRYSNAAIVGNEVKHAKTVIGVFAEHYNVAQYLLSIGIDLPSIHLGGNTLIESGLAIKKEA